MYNTWFYEHINWFYFLCVIKFIVWTVCDLHHSSCNRIKYCLWLMSLSMWQKRLSVTCHSPCGRREYCLRLMSLSMWQKRLSVTCHSPCDRREYCLWLMSLSMWQKTVCDMSFSMWQKRVLSVTYVTLHVTEETVCDMSFSMWQKRVLSVTYVVLHVTYVILHVAEERTLRDGRGHVLIPFLIRSEQPLQGRRLLTPRKPVMAAGQTTPMEHHFPLTLPMKTILPLQLAKTTKTHICI